MIVKTQRYTNKEILYTFSATFCASGSAIFSSERPPNSPDIFLSLLGQSSCHQRFCDCACPVYCGKRGGAGLRRHTNAYGIQCIPIPTSTLYLPTMECLREVERIDIEEERVECDAAQPLATISPDNFVIIDDQAAQVLSAQSRRGRLYKIYRATKSLLVSPPEVSSNDKGYDTSNWEDVNKTGKRDPDYIDATLAAEHVKLQ